MDRAGWHRTDKLKVPDNLTIILLPSRSPELNPVENVWQYLVKPDSPTASSRPATPPSMPDATAWNKLTASPETIMSIGTREWAHAGR